MTDKHASDDTAATSGNSSAETSAKSSAKTSEGIGASLANAGESVLAIAVLCGGGAWGGFQLDQHFHTAPWLAISLSMLGMTAGLTRMVMKALASEKPPKSP